MVTIRSVTGADFNLISPLLYDWWGGRQMSDMLPRLFFIHFQETSFIAEENGEIVGFLIGFFSQSHRQEAYIHFVGVNPLVRKKNIGRTLYHCFFEKGKEKGITTVRAITSPVNKSSIAFHKKMGFDMARGDKVVDGVFAFSHYDGLKQDRVLFSKKI
ncbi:GNAT family N-acetyltransferase [Bacillus weihaiensis]|uniref:GNAT family N-acetyltransferase n=1 Tax=Bacillus weihaiensis TaxID=1547283 RepID=UPI002354700C|nr:GNAT family N-acetyltransferase [Bacillus weihaiensis]